MCLNNLTGHHRPRDGREGGKEKKQQCPEFKDIFGTPVIASQSLSTRFMFLTVENEIKVTFLA